MTPTTVPPTSRSGPPLLPALIAASVWMRPSRATRRPVDGVAEVDRAAEAGDDPRGHRVGELAERAADGDDELPDGEVGRRPPAGPGARPVASARRRTSPCAASRRDDARGASCVVGEEDVVGRRRRERRWSS